MPRYFMQGGRHAYYERLMMDTNRHADSETERKPRAREKKGIPPANSSRGREIKKEGGGS